MLYVLNSRTNRRQDKASGFTLVELMIVVALIGIIMYGIGSILVKSTSDNTKLTEDIVNTTDQTVFEQLIDEVSSELGPSIDFAHLPIKVTCSGPTDTACVRSYNQTTGKYEWSTVTFTANTPTNIEFFKDQWTTNSGSALVPIEPTGSGGTSRVLKNDKTLDANDIPSGKEYYATWVLADDMSPHFTALAYSKDSTIFILEQSSYTADPVKIAQAGQQAFYKPDPPLTSGSQQAKLNTFKNRLVLVQNPNNPFQQFVQVIADGSYCDQGVADCQNDWDAYLTGSVAHNTSPTYPPSTNVLTLTSGNKTDNLVSLKLRTVSSAEFNAFTGMTPITANYSALTGDQASPFLFATDVSGSYEDDGSGGRKSLFKTTNTGTSDLLQKMASTLTTESFVAQPIEMVSLYLEKNSAWTVAKPKYRLMLKKFRGNGAHQVSTLLDTVEGFVMVQRKLGSDSEFGVVTFTKPASQVLQ